VYEAATIQSVSPTRVSAGAVTKFVAVVKPVKNISIVKYTWDFGDNSSETTNNNEVTHTYMEIKKYTLTLTIEDAKGKKTSREFTIYVVSPEEAVRTLLEDLKTRLDFIISQIDLFPLWYRGIIENQINKTELNNRITSLDRQYEQASSDEDYILIMQNLTELEIPYSIKASKTASLIFFDKVDKIDLAKISELTGSSYSSEYSKKYKQAIASWFVENIDSSIDYRLISFYYDNGIKNDVLSVFEISFEPKRELDYPLYFIIERDKDEIFFNQKYDLQDVSGATSVTVDPTLEQEIKFALLENIWIFDLPMYLTPSLDKMGVSEKVCNENGICEEELGETAVNCRKDCFSYTKFWIWFGVLLIATLIIYIILERWYKYNYESHLFKNKNDLYNLINFIYNAKRQRMSDKSIKKRLKKVGWKSEQIVYAIKKFKGQRTGMWQIPIFSWLEKKRIKEEIKRRQSQARPFV